MKIAIVDDDDQCRRQVEEYAHTYARNNRLPLDVASYSLAINFVSDYQADCDVIFLDVEMPHMDGITAAKRIRETDKHVPIIFLTGFSQYAINGYEVNALDYIMKPLTWFVFELKLKKALQAAGNRTDTDVVIMNRLEIVRLSTSEILYACSEGNDTVYHAVSGTWRERMTMRETALKFKGPDIVPISSGCLVNLAFVTRVVKDTVFLGSEQLPVSRSKRKEFVNRYIEFLSKGGYTR